MNLTSAEMDTLTDRLVATIFANDYSGTYKLGSSAPSSDYDVHLSAVFTDTRTDAVATTTQLQLIISIKDKPSLHLQQSVQSHLKEVLGVVVHFKVFKRCQMQKSNILLDNVQRLVS